mmetsp:Transcript_4181/g.5608  ORF Transcript_4181/g.5608 Transcript_4181/m.5608 type:complete len:194 (+) Transcript_4181:48-629(+)
MMREVNLTTSNPRTESGRNIFSKFYRWTWFVNSTFIHIFDSEDRTWVFTPFKKLEIRWSFSLKQYELICSFLVSYLNVVTNIIYHYSSTPIGEPLSTIFIVASFYCLIEFSFKDANGGLVVVRPWLVSASISPPSLSTNIPSSIALDPLSLILFFCIGHSALILTRPNINRAGGSHPLSVNVVKKLENNVFAS